MGLKGSTIIPSKGGLIVYGGAYWPFTNITESDDVYRKKNKFFEECRNVLNERSIIE
jgi:hypothetical protein